MKVLLERGSVRVFEERDIDDSLLEQVLEAGVRAPSGGNLQPWSAIVVRKQETKDRLSQLCGNQTFISRAPVDILFCIDMRRMERWAELEVAPFTAMSSFRHFWISFQDTIIAAQNICTAADALGLGSVYVGTVLECFRELREMFELPQGVFPVVLLSLGWPKSPPVVRNKLPQGLLIHQEKYRESTDGELLEAMAVKYSNATFPIKEESLERLEKVCNGAHGPKFAARCLDKVREQGYISMVQRYFGLHYTANTMPLGNEDYHKILEEYGFGWLRPFSPKDK
jgi:FMN reductase [NAD(P)H]